MEVLKKPSICSNQKDSLRKAKSILYEVQSYEFDQSPSEACMYKRCEGNAVVFLVLYVDNILFIGNNVKMLSLIKAWLFKQFEMKDLGEAACILGIKVIRDRKKRMLALSQEPYIDDILAHFNMQNSKKGNLSFRHGVSLSKSQYPWIPKKIENMNAVPYTSACGSLMHDILCTRPDIYFVVGMVSRYQSNPGQEHWCAVKTILKYLRRTKEYILVYKSSDLLPLGYTDSDFQTYKDKRKSTSRCVFTLGGGVVIWRSVKQKCISNSNMEAEYVAASETAKEAIWFRKFLLDLDVVPNLPRQIMIYCDNIGAVENTKEPRAHKAVKHIELRSNQRRILVSQYEGFMAKPKKSITDVFKRFNKLINVLQLHDKYYEAKEVNLKFLLTYHDHLEQKFSAITEGIDLIRIILEVLYGILKTYELEMIQRESLRTSQGHIVDGSSALVINDCNSSDDEQEIQTPTASSVEQKNKDPQKQVILELEEDELYTLDELDELDQYMAYLERKFSNINVKKTKFFKIKGQTSNKDSSWKERAQYNSGSKKGKSWDDSDNDEDDEFEKYALVALEQGESSSSKTKLVELETVKQENEYLKNKLKCATEIEAVLREKLENNEVKLKSFRNASHVVVQYYEKNKPCANITVGLNYDALNSNRKVEGDRGKTIEELVDEDNEKKCTETTPTPKIEKKPMVDQIPRNPIKEINTENTGKKKKNRNRKIGINKSNTLHLLQMLLGNSVRNVALQIV
ncbi:hypothetical protein AgCh_032098 [Apium graveolens]